MAANPVTIALNARRNVIFGAGDGAIDRKMTFHNGRTYTHRCTRAIDEEVAHAIERRATEGVTLKAA